VKLKLFPTFSAINGSCSCNYYYYYYYYYY